MSIEWRETCVRCGGLLPEGARISQDYCSRKCYMTEYRELEKQGRLDAKRNRPPCAWCGTKMPPERPGHAIYCSKKCNRLANSVTKTCPRCGSEFRGQSRQVHCSIFCARQTTKRIHKPRPCAWCGKMITRPHRHTKYCSWRCSGKVSADKRLVAMGRWPLLNPVRFDRMVGPP